MAVAGKNGEWFRGSSTSEDGRTKSLEAENKELRARIEALEKKSPRRTRTSIQEKADWRKSGGMVMDFEDEVERRGKLDEQRRRLQKEQRDVEKVLLCAERGSGKPQE